MDEEFFGSQSLLFRA